MNIIDTFQIKAYIVALKAVWNTLSNEKKEEVLERIEVQIKDEEGWDSAKLQEIKELYFWLLRN